MWAGLGSFLNTLTPDHQSLLTESAVGDRPISNSDPQLMDLVTRMRNQHQDREIAELRAILNHPNTSDVARMELIHHQASLRTSKSIPITPPNNSRHWQLPSTETPKPRRFKPLQCPFLDHIHRIVPGQRCHWHGSRVGPCVGASPPLVGHKPAQVLWERWGSPQISPAEVVVPHRRYKEHITVCC